MQQEEALRVLSRERNYEDKLAADLAMYFLASLDTIEDLTTEERRVLRDGLEKIRVESLLHSEMFTVMMNQVLEDGNADH